MPASFEKCIKDGGRVRTKILSGGRYMYICFKNGKSYAGEIHEKKPTRVSRVKGKIKSLRKKG